MANAGYSSDYKLIRHSLDYGKILKIKSDDYYLQKYLKEYVNKLILGDVVTNECWNGKNYLRHSSWDNVSKTAIKMNQLRLRHWYFKPISNG